MLDRKAAPVFVQNKSFELLVPEIQVLLNGSKLLFVNGGDQDVIKVELVFKAGKWYEPLPGISHFTGTMLPKGTLGRTSFQISDTFDFYGVHIEINPGFDFTSVALYSLPKYLPFVLDLLSEIVSYANYPESELRQAIDIYAQGLRINLEKTSYLASTAFRKSLFGNTHPYGYDVGFEDLERIRQQDLVSFRECHFGDFIGFISGKISEETKALVCDKLSQLKFSKVKQQQYTSATDSAKNSHILKEGSVQASLRIGKLTINRSHQDYPGFLLLNHILGGFFGSRLMKNIRELKGLTYGIHSYIHALHQESYFVIGADVNTDKRELAITEIKNDIRRLQTELIPDEELDTARNHFVGSLQTEMSTSFAHADKIKLIHLFNLSEDYYQQLMDSVFDVTSNQLLDLANKHLPTDELHTVTAG
jgi:zinc protease